MRDEPETQRRVPSWRTAAEPPFVGFWQRGAKPRSLGFSILRERNRGGGKVENLLLVFHFSIHLRRRRCGNAGARGKSGKPAVGLSTLSTAPAFPQRSLSSRLAATGQ